MIDFLASSNAITRTQDAACARGSDDLGSVPRLNSGSLDVALTPRFLPETSVVVINTEGRAGPPLGNLVDGVS